MTVTTVKPMPHEWGPTRRHSTKPWFIAAAVIAAVGLVLAFGVFSGVQKAAIESRPHLTPNPNPWHSSAENTAYFCGGLNELGTSLGQNTLFIATMANSAPTRSSHDATVTFYKDFANGTGSLTADLNRIVLLSASACQGVAR